ncbi:MAG: hypothetical protein JWM99_301 [Verrucomicrobiales bacterium]|nr:hypothetical protein [Verrucomicrobiales bacterium]
MHLEVMRRFYLLLLWVGLLPSLFGAEFKLLNGDKLIGEPAGVSEDGLVVRLDVGGFSPRVGWGKLTQETLKQLMENPQAKPFVEPFIEVPVEIKQKERAKKKEIIVKEVPHVDRPAGTGGFVSMLFKPPAIVIVLLLYVANIYAGIEIARFKGRPLAIVGAVCAFLPILGPLIFLATPGFGPGGEYQEATAPPDNSQLGAPDVQKAAGAGGGGLGLAGGHAKKPEAGGADPLFTRADSTFDRRFFETKFTPFFRLVPSEDKVLFVKTAKGEFQAKRISRISMNEMHLQLAKGNTEVPVPFGEILEAQVRART